MGGEGEMGMYGVGVGGIGVGQNIINKLESNVTTLDFNY